jgi:hypothetical protein
MRSIEKKLGFRSVFYFLPKTETKKNSRYHFDETRIKNLLRNLDAENCEIGLHGTVNSSLKTEESKKFKSSLEQIVGKEVQGIRQHRLLYQLPKTTLIHEYTGFNYDTTLCFAEHEGFRNSFCLPFKLYDFKNDEMINVWEIPLNVMDGTLFHYRNLSPLKAMEQIKKLMQEVQKFNGVFTLLWHNDFFDGERYPGIVEFYELLHQEIATANPENLLGTEICYRLNDLNL